MNPVKFVLWSILAVIRVVLSLLKSGETEEAISRLESLEEMLEKESKGRRTGLLVWRFSLDLYS
jgi:hypothetical protein